MYINTSMIELECHLHNYIYEHCFCTTYNYMKKFPREHQSFQCRRGQQYSSMHYSIIVSGYIVLQYLIKW
jgi:hypothetical protein